MYKNIVFLFALLVIAACNTDSDEVSSKSNDLKKETFVSADNLVVNLNEKVVRGTHLSIDISKLNNQQLKAQSYRNEDNVEAVINYGSDAHCK